MGLVHAERQTARMRDKRRQGALVGRADALICDENEGTWSDPLYWGAPCKNLLTPWGKSFDLDVGPCSERSSAPASYFFGRSRWHGGGRSSPPAAWPSSVVSSPCAGGMISGLG